MCDTRPRDTYRHAGKSCARAGLHLAAVAACHSGKSFFACSTSCGCLLQSRGNYRRSMLMGDNVCVSNQHPFRDWPARIPNVGVEVVVSMRKCVLPSREASILVAELGLLGSLLLVLLWCGW